MNLIYTSVWLMYRELIKLTSNVVYSTGVRVACSIGTRSKSSSSTVRIENIFFVEAAPTIIGGVANLKAHLIPWSWATRVVWSPAVGVGGTPTCHAPMTATPTVATIVATRAAPVGATTTSSGHGRRGAAKGAMHLEACVLFEAQ
jgi:hypothetical protein